MNSRLDRLLVKNHPILFKDRFADKRATCLCWGFECGDGWYGLLKEAADKLEPLCQIEYNKCLTLERPWYRHIRAAIGATARITPLFHVLYRLANFLLPNLYNALAYFGGPPCRASQVKEKYGTLRFYMVSSTDEMEKIIEEATRKSAKTCEECGRPGKVVGTNWLYCRCKECRRKLRKEGRI